MSNRIQNSSAQWWGIDLELTCRASNLLDVQSRIDLVTPADLVAIVGVQGVLFEEESRDSVFILEISRFRQFLFDMPDASFTWGAFYFCTHAQHQATPVLRWEPEADSLIKCQYQVRCVEYWAMSTYFQSDAVKDVFEKHYKSIHAVKAMPHQLTYGDG
jgi:hypothetical protein